MKVRFTCTGKNTADRTAYFNPVSIKPSADNAAVFTTTPAGGLTLMGLKPEVLQRISPGRAYLIEIEEERIA
jgi:hypothetical protein